MVSNQISTLKMEQKFKKTPIGEIPVDWDVSTISDVCIINPSSRSEISTLNADMEVSFIPMENIREEGRGISTLNVRPLREVAVGYTYFKDGDLLFAKITPCMENGKVAIAKNLKNRVGFGSTEFHVLRSKDDKLLGEFLFYWMSRKSFRDFARKHFTGTAGQQRVQKHFFSATYIPLPDKMEQKKIIEILMGVDDIIKKTNAVIQKTKELKKGLMQQLLTRDIGHIKLKKTPIGEIPVDWEVVSLGNICCQSEDKFDPLENKSVPYIGLEHIDGFGNLLTIGDSSSVKSLKTWFRVGSILFGKLRPYLRKVTKVNFDGVCSTDIMVIVPSDGVNADFILYVLQSDAAINFSIGTSAGTKMPRTSWSLFSKFQFPLPPFPEQKKIAEILSSVDDEISKEEAYRENLEQTKNALMQVLLTGKIRVAV